MEAWCEERGWLNDESVQHYPAGMTREHVEPRKRGLVEIGYWGATEQKTRLRIQATSTIESDGIRHGRPGMAPEDIWATLESIIRDVYGLDTAFEVSPDTVLRLPR
jgi:hypothetical protein